MTHKRARLRAIAEWLMEVSALIVVFPALDLFLQTLEGRELRWGLMLVFFTAALFLFTMGVLLIRDE